MNAMILAAGFGTRLLPHTERIPKPLFPILDDTLLGLTIKTVMEAGPGRIVINAFHLAGQIEDYVAGRDFGAEIIVSRENEILGTAGGIKNAEKWLKDGDFIVMNSDIIMDVDWDALIQAHRNRNAVSTLLLRENTDPEKYSELRIGRDGRITRFAGVTGPDYSGIEKPLMFTGVSVLSPAIFDMIPAGRFVDISKEIYMPMTRSGEGLYGAAAQSAWTDVGTTADYHETVMKAFATADLTPAVIWGELKGIKITPPVYIETGAVIEPGASIGPRAAVHKDARVGQGASLRNCVALPGSVVAPGASHDGVVI